MLVLILGSAAGGGFPQWNCGCPGCRAVRSGSGARPRTQSSVAVSPDGDAWFLFNVSPDIRVQMERSPALYPRSSRETPIEAVLLTDAELDHTAGLLSLRETRRLRLHATPEVRRVLCDGNGVLRTLAAYTHVEWVPVPLDEDIPLERTDGTESGLAYRAFSVGSHKPDRFGTPRGPGSVVGYVITDRRTGGRLAYVPGLPAVTPQVLAAIDGAGCLLVDGTCWDDDELPRLGLGTKTARSMGHVPINGPDGSLALLAPLPIGTKIYIHMNNTNPILLEASLERRHVEASGMVVGFDGLETEV